MQRERVQDQYPWTWEIPLAIVCAVLVVGVAACQLGRSVANWFAGAGWRWPTPNRLVTSVPGLLAGDGAAGLPDIHHAANAAALWGWTVPSLVDTGEVSEFPTMRGTASWDRPVELSLTSTRRMP